MRSPWAFSRPNSSSSLSISLYEKHSSLLTFSVASTGCSPKCPYLSCTRKPRTAHSIPGVASPVLPQGHFSGLCPACCPPRPPGSFLQRCLQVADLQCVLAFGVISLQELALSFFELGMFFSAHSSCRWGPSGWQPSNLGYQTLLVLYHQENCRECAQSQHEDHWTKTLNSVEPSISLQGTPLASHWS